MPREHDDAEHHDAEHHDAEHHDAEHHDAEHHDAEHHDAEHDDAEHHDAARGGDARPAWTRRIRRHPTFVAGAAAVALLAVILATIAVSRGGEDSPHTTVTSPSGRCIVQLHGKGGAGAATELTGDTAVVRPAGNAAGWGGRQWQYFPAARYDEARQVVTDAITAAGCTRVALDGFSNGAAFAASLYCHGETFAGRLVGVMIDDPVTDHAVEGCAPAANIPVALYWTGALEGQAVAGWPCEAGDWTCDGGTTIGIDAYAAALGTTPVASPHTEHEPTTDAPEPARWLAA